MTTSRSKRYGFTAVVTKTFTDVVSLNVDAEDEETAKAIATEVLLTHPNPTDERVSYYFVERRQLGDAAVEALHIGEERE